MKKKYALLYVIVLLALGNLFFFQSAIVSNAKTDLYAKKFTLYSSDEKVIHFKLKSKGIIYFEVDVSDLSLNSSDIEGSEVGSSNGKTGISICLSVFDSKLDDIVDYDEYTVYISKGDTSCGFWYYTDEIVPKGDYYLYLSPVSSDDDFDSFKCNVNISYYKEYATSVKVPSSITVLAESWKDLKTSVIAPKGSMQAIDWKSSNKKIAEVYKDHGNGIPTVYGNKKGTCTITGTLPNGKIYKCKVTVKNPKPYLNYKSIESYKGKKTKLQLKYPTGKVKWSTSNKHIATVDSKGVVKGISVGSCVVTAKCKGVSYKCKIKVVYRDPNFGAANYNYLTRNNYFLVKFKNNGNKTLTITSGIKAVDVDYKEWDRKVKLKSAVQIKPKQTKYVKFYVVGSYAYPDYRDYTIYYNFKYDGKTYEGHVWDEDSVYKYGKHWYSTYWNEIWYGAWL